MTMKDTIAALPWYQRSAVDSLINQWDNENKLTRFLQGAGNKEEIEALIADFKYQDWTMFSGPEAEPRPGEEVVVDEDVHEVSPDETVD